MDKELALPKDTLESLKNRYNRAYQLNQRFINLLIRATHLCAPLSDGLDVLYGFDDTGKNVNGNIFNATPKTASNLRANKMHTLLCPINKQWGSVQTVDKGTGQLIPQQEITNGIFNAIDSSNIHSVLKSFFVDLNIGCGALFVESSDDKKRPLIFKNIAGITLMPEMNDDPTNNNCWWRKIISHNDLVSISPKRAADAKSKGEDKYYITCGFLKEKVSGKNEYIYIEILDDDFDNPLTCERRPCNQLILVNETLRPGESRGHGVILQILEDIEYLNDLSESYKSYVCYAANPALLGDDNMPKKLGQLRGARLPSSFADDGKPAIEPLMWNLPVEVIWQTIKDIENKILLYFNVLPFGEVANSPVRTATETAARQSESESQSIADITRVANELIRGTMQTVYHIEVARGNIKATDNIDFIFDVPQIEIQNQEDANRLLQYTQMSEEVNGQGTTVLLNDQQRTDQYLKNLFTVPKQIAKTPEELKATIKNQMEAEQNGQEGQSKQLPPSQPTGAVNPSPLQL